MNKYPFPARMSIIHVTPALMVHSERVVLYSTVLGLEPTCILEIGTHKGGSALVMTAALDDLENDGRIICVDPQPVISPDTWDLIKHRATMITGNSPEVLNQARDVAGRSFDFALIDGDHETPGLIRDIEGVLPLLDDHAYLLFHDAFYVGVRKAIDTMLEKYSDHLTDCGMISNAKNNTGHMIDGEPGIWGGLRLLRYRKPAR